MANEPKYTNREILEALEHGGRRFADERMEAAGYMSESAKTTSGQRASKAFEAYKRYLGQDPKAVKEAEANENAVNAKLLDGKPSNAERIIGKAIAEAFDGKEAAVMGSGQVRPSDEKSMWLAQLGTETAAESLRLAFMAKNPGMQAREVGNAADAKLIEFYTEASKNTPYEAARLDYVQHQAKKLAKELRGDK